MPRPIPREPPVTRAYFPVSVIKHLLAQILWRILGASKSRVNHRGRTADVVYTWGRAGELESVGGPRRNPRPGELCFCVMERSWGFTARALLRRSIEITA